MSKTTVAMFARANQTPAGNVAAKESFGHKKSENLFSNSFVGSSAGGVSYVNSKTRSTIDQQGVIVGTGVTSDLGIDGAGLLAVSDTANGAITYTRRGDFRQDELGFWKNGSGQLLKAWKLDGNGNLPQNSSLLSSLEAVNFANTKGLPVQTSIISIAMNLNSDQSALRGPGPENNFEMQRSGNNKITKAEDILLPDQVGTRGLRAGDEFTLKSSAGEDKVITYGGFTSSNKATETTRIFGSASAITSFTFSNGAAAPGVLLEGQQLKIGVTGGSTYTFTAMPGQASGTNFNSLSSLAAAINKISVLNARVVDDRIYIAPIDASKGLNYSNGSGGTNIVETLGLRNLVQSDPGENRFNSIRSLRDVVNTNQSIDSLLATIEGSDIKITSLLSTSSFRIDSNQVDGNRIERAVTNPGNIPEDGGTVLIEARNSNLIAGDFVRLTGMADVRLPNGVYVVGKSDTNGFTVNIIGGEAAYVMGQGELAIPAGATWQIANGAKEGLKDSIITAAALGASGVIEITSNAHGYANGDVIYTDGGVFELNLAGNKTITLPAGYYTVTNTAANTFDIAATNVTAAGAGAGSNALAFRKVGGDPAGVNGGNAPFNTTVFTTGALGSTEVTYSIGNDNHGYTVGSSIRFADLPGAAMDGITLYPDVDYTITAIASNSITFEANNAAAVAAGGAGVATVGAQNIDLAAQPGTRFDNHSRLFSYFGLDPDKNLYEASYDPTNADKNITSGNFPTTETFSHPLTIFDSLGSSYTVILNFAKLDNNKWAVELAAQADENGIFDIDGLITTNGVIKYGIIEFDENGAILDGAPEGFEEPITIQRSNGSAVSTITIDWQNDLSDITSGTLSQTKNPNNVEIVQSNGQAAGTLLNLSITPDGIINGTFDSGESRDLYKIPLAIFANVNGLLAGANGTFNISRESGQLLLKQANQSGAGKTLGGVLEASNVDSTEELLKVQELSNTIRANARVTATEFKNISAILNELNQ